MKRTTFVNVLVIAALIASVGCKKDESSSVDTGGPDAAKGPNDTAAQPAVSDTVTQPGSPAPTAISGTNPSNDGPASAQAKAAAAAVSAVIKGVQQNQAQTVWDFFPGSYQKDINDLIHTFADNSDPELWNQTFGSMKKIVAVLKNQKKFILNSPQFQKSKVDPQQLAANWDQSVEFLNTIVSSEASDLKKLKTLNAGTFLAGTGKNLLLQLRALTNLNPNAQDPFQKLAQIQVTPLASPGDKTVVRIESPDQEPQEIEFVNVEGKWIPQKMAATWAERIADVKTKVAASSQQTPEKKKKLLTILGGLDQLLDQLAKAKTQEEFDPLFQQTMITGLGMMMLFSGQGPGFPQPGAKPSQPPQQPDSKSPSKQKPSSKGKKKPETEVIE